MFMHPFSPLLPLFGAPIFAALFVLLAVWSLFWKGFALWFSARNQQKAWFIVMLIVNTAGILEIVYLVWFRNPRTPNPTLFEAASSPAAGTPSADSQA